MNKAHFSLKLRKDRPRKDGTYGIYLYGNINGKLTWFSTDVSVPLKCWNEKTHEVRSSCPNWADLNKRISLYLSKAKDYIFQCNLEDKKANKTTLRNLLGTAEHYTNDYLSFVENYITEYSATYAPKTLKGFRTHINKLREYKPVIAFDDIDPVFWAGYESFLKEKGNRLNTIHKQARLLKQFLNKAVEFGIIRKNLLEKIKVKKEDGNRQYLTINEVNKLHEIFNTSNELTRGEKNVLRYFLFACYTGLRYSDIKQLKYRHILEGEKINLTMDKTGKLLDIPLNKRAKSVLIPEKETIPNAPVFKVYTNQVTNRHLKTIMKNAGIKKQISFHCARHTWATITLELTQNIAVVSKILGHSSIKITQIYAKVLERAKKEAMDKWDDI